MSGVVQRGWTLRRFLVAASLLGLGACGGGGGGGGGSTGTATPSTPAPTTTVAAVGPSVGSPEYLQNYGVAAIKAEAGWAKGASGQGILVGVIDSGVNSGQPDLAGRVSGASTDINTSRNQLYGADQHGTLVAGIIASNYNGSGTVGVAFGSTILSVRADNGNGAFSTNDLATAIDYAVANGARVINLSLGTTTGPAGPAFEAAMQRAVNAGVVFAVAAGNDGLDIAEWPGGYSVDPRYAGSILMVGSLNQAGELSSFSHRAGSAGGGFVVAPGEGVVTNCNGVTCTRVSGTSFSAPHVSGALALVLQAYPNLTGRQAVDLLARTARDLGAPGNDPIYGWGAIDLQRAFAPVGSLSVAVPGDGFVSASLTPGTMIGAAFGDSMQATNAMATVGYDDYDRPFATDLGAVYAATRASILSPHSSDLRRHTDVDLDLAGGRSLNISAGLVDAPMASPADRFPWMPSEDSRDVTLSYRTGRLGLTAWTGKASSNPFAASNPDAFTALAQPEHAVRADYDVGRWMLSAEAGGGGERRSPDLLRREDGSRYMRASGSTLVGGALASITFGQLVEPLGPLGAYIPSRTGMTLPSRTAFAAFAAQWPLGDGFDMTAEASVGRTRLSGRFLSLEEAAWSSSWKVSFGADCRTLGMPCSGLRLTAAQPLRIESGRFLAHLPDVPSTYFGPSILSDRRFGAAPSGRQTDFTLTATQATMLNGLFQLDGVASVDAGHRADSGPAYGLLASWKADF